MHAQQTIHHGLQECHTCTSINSQDSHTCRYCRSELHQPATPGLQYTWAWLFTSVILYIPANISPIMFTVFLGSKSSNTLIEGVFVLWEHKSYPIALIIFIASILIPISKMIAIAWLCIAVQFNHTATRQRNMKLYRIVEFIGRWSMIDIFVVGILVALIQLGSVMSIHPGIATISFAGMVITTMMAAMSFNTKLIWQQINHPAHND